MLMGMSFLLSRELLLNLVKNVPVYNYVITSDIFLYNVSIIAAPCHTYIMYADGDIVERCRVDHTVYATADHLSLC